MSEARIELRKYCDENAGNKLYHYSLVKIACNGALEELRCDLSKNDVPLKSIPYKAQEEVIGPNSLSKGIESIVIFEESELDIMTRWFNASKAKSFLTTLVLSSEAFITEVDEGNICGTLYQIMGGDIQNLPLQFYEGECSHNLLPFERYSYLYYNNEEIMMPYLKVETTIVGESSSCCNII